MNVYINYLDVLTTHGYWSEISKSLFWGELNSIANDRAYFSERKIDRKKVCSELYNRLEEKNISSSNTLYIYIDRTCSDNLEIRQAGWSGDYFIEKMINNCRFEITDKIVMSNACASIGYAISLAKKYIFNGIYENVMIFSLDLITLYEYESMRSLKVLSNESAKPFSEARNGININDGGGILLLGSNPLSKNSPLILGCETHENFHSGSLTNSEDISILLRNFSDIKFDVIVAHAAGTPKGDAEELSALQCFAGSEYIPITSIKGAIGHSLYSSGLAQIACALDMIKVNYIYPTVGYTKSGHSSGGAFVNTQPFRKNVEKVLVNMFGFYGNYSAIAIGE